MYAVNVLVVEDEERLRKLVVKYLNNENYSTYEAENGSEALDMWNDQSIDLIILDVMLPDYDGWSVLREIRKESDVPVIMLTARAEENDKIFGFELGADDYVTKPFSAKELIARVKALLKRSNKNTIVENLVFGNMTIYTKSKQVIIDNKEIDLTPKEYDLLLYFVDNKNIALTRDSILDRVWGYDYYGDLRTVDTHVKRLRSKIKNSDLKIVTVRGTGYRFEVKV